MVPRLRDKVVVITGASRGLGAGMAAWFLEQGASVGVCARTKPDIDSGRAVAASVDVTDKPGMMNFADAVGDGLGPIDLWINNAAVLEPIISERELTSDQLLNHLSINVAGVLNGTQVFLDHLEKADHQGALVNVSSGLGKKGMAGLAAYAAAKAAVDRLTEVIAIEETKLLSLALAVSPGVVETDMQAALRDQDSAVLHDVELFRDFAEDRSMNSPGWVAEVISSWVFDGARPDGVVVRVPRENA